MDKSELRDRVFKTFIEVFLGVLVPDIGVIVNQIVTGREVWWAVLLPIVATALATAISAAWNVLRPPKAAAPAPEPEATVTAWGGDTVLGGDEEPEG